MKYVSCRKGFDAVDAFEPFVLASEHGEPSCGLLARSGADPTFAMASDKEIVMVHGYNCTSQNVQDAYRANHEIMAEEGLVALPLDAAYPARPVSGFMWPGLGGNWVEAAEFHRAQSMADQAAPRLAAYLSLSGAKDLTVIAHSLGCRVALQATLTVPIKLLVLLGASVDEDALTSTYLKASANVGKILVMHSLRDEVLGKLYRLDQMDFALGFKGPKYAAPWIESVDVSTEVSGHNQYRHSRAVWRKIKESL